MIAPADFSPPLPADSAKPRTAGASRAAASRLEALHDATLVRRFNAGDETAFVEIMTRYRERMLAVALSMLKSRTDAEEIAQDTFIRAHRALAKFRGDSSLSTWLHRIALNLARNRYWYFFRRRRHATVSLNCALSDDNQTTLADRLASGEAGPVRAIAAGEFSELIATCMQQLGNSHREILALRNSLNRSYGEIARELGISVGTVKSRIARARGQLHALLAKACPEFGPAARLEDWFDPIRPGVGAEILCA